MRRLLSFCQTQRALIKYHAQAVAEAALPARDPANPDPRVTGVRAVDEPLHAMLAFMLRDYVASWYNAMISPDTGLELELHRMAQTVLVRLARGLQAVDWVAFCTSTVVDEFARHLRQYQRAVVRGL